MGLSRTVSEIDGDFSRKSQISPLPPALNRFRLELGIGARSQRLEWCDYQAEKEVWRFFSRLDTMHLHDRWTEGQIDGPTAAGDSKDRAYA